MNSFLKLKTQLRGQGKWASFKSFLLDPSIKEVDIQRFDRVKVYKSHYSLIPSLFRDDRELCSTLDWFEANYGYSREKQASSKAFRFRLGVGIVGTCYRTTLAGKTVAMILKLNDEAVTLETYLEWKSLSPEMATLLRLMMKKGRRVLVSGNKGSGRAIFLNALGSSLVDNEFARVAHIGTSRLPLQPPNYSFAPLSLLNRAHASEQFLAKLRNLKTDIGLLDSCDGPEAYPIIRLGSEGFCILTSTHADTCEDTLTRFAALAKLHVSRPRSSSVNKLFAMSFDYFIRIERLKDGSRKVVKIAEFSKGQDGCSMLQDIFVFEPTGENERGRIHGRFSASGFIPRVAKDGLGEIDFAVFDGAERKPIT